jgi:hypothetical protein
MEIADHLDVPRHPDRPVHFHRFTEERSRFVAVPRCVPVEEHLSVPAAHFGLGDSA